MSGDEEQFPARVGLVHVIGKLDREKLITTWGTVYSAFSMKTPRSEGTRSIGKASILILDELGLLHGYGGYVQASTRGTPS